MRDITDEHEIAGLTTVAVDHYSLVAPERFTENCHHARLTGSVLPWPINVCITKRRRADPVGCRIRLEVVLEGELGDSVVVDRVSRVIFVDRHSYRLAVHGRRRGADDARSGDSGS